MTTPVPELRVLVELMNLEKPRRPEALAESLLAVDL